MESNPFSPPGMKYAQFEPEHKFTYPDAKNGKRFLNSLIDTVVYSVFSLIINFVFDILVVATAGGSLDQLASMELTLTIFSLLASVMYTLMESMYGVTIGKLATGTRVVDIFTHEKPSLSRVLLRSVCRFIPFEPLSFFGSKPGGWHDRLSKTRTIDIRATPITIAEYEEMRDLQI